MSNAECPFGVSTPRTAIGGARLSKAPHVPMDLGPTGQRSDAGPDSVRRDSGRGLAAESYLRAASIARDWWGGPWQPVLQRRWDRRLWALGVLGGPVPDQLLRAVLHPEAVVLAGLLASPSWDARLRAGHATVWDLHRAVAARLALDARRPTTAEPLVRWLTMGHPWAGRCPRGLQLQHEDLLPPLAQLEVGQGAAGAAHRGGSDARR
jgi:hypothetical protein